jgi:hypothetical protein
MMAQAHRRLAAHHVAAVERVLAVPQGNLLVHAPRPDFRGQAQVQTGATGPGLQGLPVPAGVGRLSVD